MDNVYFTINGDHYNLSGSEVSPSTSLNDYLRNYLGLVGTKAMCHEGGCGACVVSVAQTHPVTKEKQVFAVNSCLVHILQCHQWDITTIEGLGNRKDGYSPFQTRLAKFNGTQCGYCTPGWVMSMYSLYEGSHKKLSTKQIERSFGSNMCRCTGYRPILDAYKTFAIDHPSQGVKDLEDLHEMKCITKRNDICGVDDDWCVIEKIDGTLMNIGAGPNRWYKAFKVEDVFTVLKREGTKDYTLVAGNTAKGVYPPDKEPRVHIDISSIESLKDSFKDENLVLGAGMSLSALMEECKRHSSHDDFWYLEHFYNHLDLVAHVPVRNIGTIGGNLVMKNAHHDFISDVFVLLRTVNSTVTIINSHLQKTEVTLDDFLKVDLNNKLILDVKVPPLSKKYIIRTYKIMPRAQNAHAIVSAGFLFHLNSAKKVMASNLIFGGISQNFINASETEAFLKGRELINEETVQLALKKLQDEILPEAFPPEPSPYCRKAIALGLFYKAILSLDPPMNVRYKSGGTLLQRPVSRATQTYDTDKTLWPLNQPVPKLEALSQCAGEANYVCDITSSSRDVHVVFVLSEISVGEIESIDASKALKMNGILGFYSAKDIPGKNCFTPNEVPWQEYEEEIFASKTISYLGQPIGVIAATSKSLAFVGSDLVKINYKKSTRKPVLSIKEALQAPDKDKRIKEEVTVDPTAQGTDIKHVIKGSYVIPDQYHYTMEAQSVTVKQTRRGLSVRAATQWMDLVHVAVARMLNVPLNTIEVSVPRVGGAYGGKASRSSMVACACALVAHKLNRRATLVMPLGANMAAIGKRQMCYAEYEVGVNDVGLIQYMKLQYYSDCGCSYNDSSAPEISGTLTNLYDSSRWSVKGYSVLTDKASNTWCRAPATNEGTAIMEHIMERIAHVTKQDTVAVRLINIDPKHTTLRDMIDTFKADANYKDRRSEITKFNDANAWKKKGLKLSVMSYPISYSGNYSVTISVYHADGTIIMSHGGIEMGQGINTKAAQVCAYVLGVPLSMVTVRGSDSFVCPNAMASNGSITSECVAHATVKACKELLERLAPIKNKMNKPTWQEVVKTAFDDGINLQVSSMMSPLDNLVGYNVYGVCAVEIEMDVLTGNHLIHRVDLLEDTGKSLSPEVDVGQVEGAFIMGLGLWTTERLIYSPDGELLTNNTWTYKPPSAQDIPIDFRVTFKRNSSNPFGVLRSKATGEPALVLAVAITFALHEAIEEARKEYGYKDDKWIDVATPYSVENIITAISPKIGSYKLK
ncbi:uncharacterized protein [Epargyreus clarus]|uniref:uncharacterized protein n=1 Tax=Epargyreus clarus TaxID=520877 RepID=UPI003C30B425